MDDQRAGYHARSQQELIDFLNTDLDLGFTMLQTAVIADGQAHIQQACSNVRNAIVTIRDLSRGVEDANIRAEIKDRVDRLDTALKEFAG